MNKKLLLAATALAALTACTNDDFENLGSTNATEGTSPVQFEVLNNNEAVTRASMDGNTIKWSAADGDLFTLYHGAEEGQVTGFQNATYKASSEEGAAILSTPSMILPGGAIMVWPVDTVFNIASDGNLSITIPAVQTNIENNIPYVSDLINIAGYDGIKAAPNTAGYNRTYPVYMRPMASQLIVKADYAGTDETIEALYDGGSACPADGGIEPISVISVVLKAGDANKFTTEIAVAFTDTTTFNTNNNLEGANRIKNQWNTSVANNAWTYITSFGDVNEDEQVNELTTKCLTGNESCKFLILPQDEIGEEGVAGAGVVVNTIYGKVVIDADNYGDDYDDAWYRFVSATTAADEGETKAAAAGTDGKFKTTANIAMGMRQTLNGFGAATASKGVVKGEPVGVAATRYVKVLLDKLDMQDLHITSDKQLRDAAVVWKYLNPEATEDEAVEVILDGDEDGEFAISQNTIKFINTLKDEDGNHLFKVKPCVVDGEECETIVITGGGDIQDIAFIVANGEDEDAVQAAVALNEGETWKWKGATSTVKTVKVGTGVSGIINRGTLVNAATATLKNFDAAGAQANVPLTNEGIWNITAGTLNVQFSVTNIGTVNIAKGAQYRQDGENHIFTNDAETLPQRFLAANTTEKIGVVNNKGVFATVNTGVINNYGLIEHADKDAMTFITSNQTEEANFTTGFDADDNKMGRINLPFSNKNEDNISINAAAEQGFVSVTVTTTDAPATKKLDASVVGTYVNYVIVVSGIEQITAVSNKIKYVEINQPGTMIDWEPQYHPTTHAVIPFQYTGLMILSDVNIKLGTKVNAGTTYLGADMYVGGEFNKTETSWNGYFGETEDNVATKYITFGN